MLIFTRGLVLDGMPVKLRVLGEHALAVVAIALLTSLAASKPLWRAGRGMQVDLLVVLACYSACAVAFAFQARRGSVCNVFARVLTFAATFSPAVVVLVARQPKSAAFVLLVALALSVLFMWSIQGLQRFRKTRVSIMVTVLGLAGLAETALAGRWMPTIGEFTVTHFNSTLYPLRATFYEHFLSSPRSSGGAIALFADRYLLATGDGALYLFKDSPDSKSLHVEKLAYRVPINWSDFSGDVHETKMTRRFRVADILLDERGPDALRLYASHHYWRRADSCSVVRISRLEGRREEILDARHALQWKTIYESSPCLRVKQPSGKSFFTGIEIGGRLAMLPDGRLMLTLGDQEFDGLGGKPALSQMPDVSYGKTLLIDPETRAAEIYSLGHRNPQGLAVDASGRIWSTEHGPQGGDELNLIERGKNYGWPLVTYGVNYGTHSWPENATPGLHTGFEQPRFAWIPSVAVSNLILISKELFGLWDGDLIIGTLRDQSLWRLKYVDDHVVLTERLPIGQRIRDLLEDERGRIVVWTDNFAIGFIDPEKDPKTGAERFASLCSGCHVMADGGSHGIGPDLHHVVGRRIAGLSGFTYSSALAQRSGKWTPRTLDAFLKNPDLDVPGTAMQFPGIPDADARRSLIEYLSDATEVE
jgi:cytochrome c2